MASNRIQALLREVDLVVADIKSGKTARQQFVSFARKEIAEAEATNRQATGHDVPYRTAVDGKIGAPLEGVREGGTIAAHFELHSGMLQWIGDMLVKESPVLTGRYAKSHVLFIDGVEHDPETPLPDFEEAIFVNVQPYARKIERGLSNQAPDGVYQAVAAVARSRYGNLAAIKFSYRSIQGGGLVKYKAAGQASKATRGAKGRFTGSTSQVRTASQMAEARKEHETRQPAIVVVVR